MLRVFLFSSLSALFGWLALSFPALAADNELTMQEMAEGYILLFNGRDFEGFNAPRSTHFSKWIIEDGEIRTCLFGGQARFVAAGSLYTTRDDFENYILKVDFRIPSKESKKNSHSGIMLRVKADDIPLRDALEFDIYGVNYKSPATCTGSFRHNTSPAKKQTVRQDGGWNSLVITVNKNLIVAELNGEVVNELNLDQWTTAGVRPDGKPGGIKNIALKDLPRKGAIGFRDDHGNPVWFKNIKLKPLP